jgi:hypothetical protein
MTPKFRRATSIRPRMKSFRICKIPCFINGQQRRKKATGKPSGPGAVSVYMPFTTSSNSFSEKVSAKCRFSAALPRDEASHASGAILQIRSCSDPKSSL